MSTLLVAGLINIETTLQVEGFPLEYMPVRYPFFGVNSTVSGVGYNVAKALTTLGDDVRFLSMVGQDVMSHLVYHELRALDIDNRHVLPQLKQTPQSVVMYESSGRRAIYTDLKDIQEQTYPLDYFETALQGCSLAALSNINFTRAMLSKVSGIPIATDVHVISNLHDTYNSDYMRHAHILFQRHEHLPCTPEDWVRSVWKQYGTAIVVVGLGSEGALLGVREHNFIERVPAVYTRPVVNSVGAGDALFSAFVHTYAETKNPYTALQKAVIFASYKIGEKGAAEGFLTSQELDRWHMDLIGAK